MHNLDETYPALRQAADIPGVIELMRRVYRPPHGPEALWKPEALAAHLERFPEGQILLKDGSGRVLADSTGAILPSALALRPHTWSEATGRGTLSTHDPKGEVFYGVDIAVDPSLQGMGLAKKLYGARLDLARVLGCRWFAAGARIPGYHKVAHLLSPETYLAEGNLDKAAELAARAVEHTRAPLTAMIANEVRSQRIMAFVEAARGDLPAAAARLDDIIARTAAIASPSLCGTLHDARARIALASGDVAMFLAHSNDAGELFAGSRNPVLIARGERLRETGASSDGRAALRATLDDAVSASTPSVTASTCSTARWTTSKP